MAFRASGCAGARTHAGTVAGGAGRGAVDGQSEWHALRERGGLLARWQARLPVHGVISVVASVLLTVLVNLLLR
jgi:hypothetical protein